MTDQKFYITEEGAYQYGVYETYIGEDARDNESWHLMYSYQQLEKAEETVNKLAKPSLPFKYKIVDHLTQAA